MGLPRRLDDPIEKILTEASWRRERLLSWVRAAIWGTVGIPFFAATPGWASVLPFVASAVSIAGAFGLRHRFRRWIPPVMVFVDLLLACFMIDAGYRQFDATEIALRDHMIYGGILVSLLLVSSTNFLRMSIAATVTAMVTAPAAYTLVLWRNDALTSLSGADYMAFLSMGAMSLWLARETKAMLRRSKERDAFARFLPAPAVERLTLDPEGLSTTGAEQESTVLFSDVRGFTAISSELPPAEVVAMLNEYFAEMVEELFQHGGVLDKFIGDGICAVFEPDVGGADHAQRAVSCALGMTARLDRLNARRVSRGEPPLAIGIGLHSGRLIAGSIGSPLRLEYTHIGDTVNVASRVEGLTKEAGRSVLVTDATLALVRVPPGIEAVPLAPMPVKGKAEPLQVYALVAATGPHDS